MRAVVRRRTLDGIAGVYGDGQRQRATAAVFAATVLSPKPAAAPKRTVYGVRKHLRQAGHRNNRARRSLSRRRRAVVFADALRVWHRLCGVRLSRKHARNRQRRLVRHVEEWIVRGRRLRLGLLSRFGIRWNYKSLLPRQRRDGLLRVWKPRDTRNRRRFLSGAYKSLVANSAAATPAFTLASAAAADGFQRQPPNVHGLVLRQ